MLARDLLAPGPASPRSPSALTLASLPGPAPIGPKAIRSPAIPRAAPDDPRLADRVDEEPLAKLLVADLVVGVHRHYLAGP